MSVSLESPQSAPPQRCNADYREDSGFQLRNCIERLSRAKREGSHLFGTGHYNSLLTDGKEDTIDFVYQKGEPESSITIRAIYRSLSQQNLIAECTFDIDLNINGSIEFSMKEGNDYSDSLIPEIQQKISTALPHIYMGIVV